MSIEGIGTMYGETSSYTIPKKELGKEDFLTLLVEQLKHQDPLNPMESMEFTAQLAQFSSLEQLFGMNENLAGIQEVLSNQSEETLLELIGKTVKADDNSILVSDGSAISGAYTLDEPADVTISIYDSEGSEIRTLYHYGQNAGEYNIDWDGRDNSGEKVEDGIYYHEVAAKDENGDSIDVNTYISGEVTGITYEYGVPYLIIGDKLVSSDNAIIEVTKTAAIQ